MPRVTLQDYLNQIEQLVDENRLAEAATHCRYILQQYPRHVDTYRLLGRVLLEQQKYSEAINVFERVASADPEDMIVQAGLALAYKENLDLPRAVWHMERAFELDPYNRAIQDELSELYAARDGYTRERIELNRAALARLYFRSAMYGKAASELTRLLKQKPKRLDLQILLADALFWEGGPSDLVEVCLGIVEEMPYCIKANAILAAAWMHSSRPMEAEEHWRRVQSLTLMTARSIDPDSTLGRALSLGDGLGFPQEVMVEDLDEIAAAKRQSSAMDDLATESVGDPASSNQIPGWLHEIGFTVDEEIELEEEEPAFQNVPEPIDEDWLDEVALAAGLGLAVEERLKDESADDEIFSDELVALVGEIDAVKSDPYLSEVEPEIFDLLENELDLIAETVDASESESAVQDPVEAAEELFDEDLTLTDAALLDEEVIEINAVPVEEELGEFDTIMADESPIGIEQEVPPADQSPEAIVDEAFGIDSWEQPVISRETGQVSDEYSDLHDDMTDLVEELQARRKRGTSLLPDLDEVQEERKKGSDWLDDLAEDSDVTDDLPEWLYETVGFTDQLPELPEEERGDVTSLDKTVAEGHAENAEPAEIVGRSGSEANDLGGHDNKDWGSEWPVIDGAAKDDDLPEWLLDADEVLEELPDEVSQGSADSWLQGQSDKATDIGWLDELAPKAEKINDEPSGDKFVFQEQEPPTPPDDIAQEIAGDVSDFQEDEFTWPSSADDEQDQNATAEKSDDGG